MLRSSRFLVLLLAVTLSLTTFGCSMDKHTFVSTVNQPTTLTLLDTTANESIWEMDIPVNHMLVLDFENSPKSHNAGADGSPAWVNWKLYRTDDKPQDVGIKRKGTLVLSDRIDLTNVVARMQVSYRQSPELPGSLDAAPVPTMDTPESVAEEAAAEAKAQSAAKEQEAPAAKPEAEDTSMDEADKAVEEAEKTADEAAKQVDEAEKAVK